MLYVCAWLCSLNIVINHKVAGSNLVEDDNTQRYIFTSVVIYAFRDAASIIGAHGFFSIRLRYLDKLHFPFQNIVLNMLIHF